MSTRPALEFIALQKENAELRLEVEQLRARLNYLGQYRTLAAGLHGEELVSKLVGGIRTAHTASVDIITDDDIRIEVKLGKLTYPKPTSAANPARWQWGKVLGEKNTKDFDYLVLVGESDPRFSAAYREQNAPYILFLLERNTVQRVSVRHTNGARGILLLTNPLTSGIKAREFFNDFQITASELAARFGTLVPATA